MGRTALNQIQRDDEITLWEVDAHRMAEIGQTLDKWGKVRASTGATGFVEIAGWDRIWSKEKFKKKLKEKFVFPIKKDDGQGFSSTELISSDRRRVQFGGDPEDVASDIQQEAEQVAAGSNSQTNSGASAGLLAALAGVVVLAVAVLGGN